MANISKELEEISPAGSTTIYLGYKKFVLAKQQTTDLLQDAFKMAVRRGAIGKVHKIPKRD